MTDLTGIPEITLPDRNGNPTRVHRGDRVCLRDISSAVDEDERYFAEEDRDFHLQWLGEGQYEVLSIGQWPCGRVMVYVKTRTSSDAGVFASDLAYWGINPQAKEISVM